MDTIEIFPLMVALTAGIGLGVIFFGGLWLTVQKGLISKHPALWFLSSLLLRSSICLLGFYWIGKDHPERLLICLAGFIAARMLVVRMTSQLQSPNQAAQGESDHAP
jgi:F1F0 ATPase subunit 2